MSHYVPTYKAHACSMSLHLSRAGLSEVMFRGPFDSPGAHRGQLLPLTGHPQDTAERGEAKPCLETGGRAMEREGGEEILVIVF